MATEIKKNDTTREKLIILLAKYIKECSKKLNERQVVLMSLLVMIVGIVDVVIIERSATLIFTSVIRTISSTIKRLLIETFLL